MEHCIDCGAELVLRECEGEGQVPYCESCKQFRFPGFSAAIITAVINRAHDKVLLLRQYGRPSYILLAGYISKGESAEQALKREVKEEMDLEVTGWRYMQSQYFAPSNTLMLNFISYVQEDTLHPAPVEVDDARWFTFEEALQAILPNSLAEMFLKEIIKLLQNRGD